MAAGNFEKCHAVTARWEGGWSNHPEDPGGATQYGITLAKFREHYPGASAAALRAISRKQAEDIYRKDFWQGVSAETLAPGVDLAAYDAGVNSGPARARKWLLASVGGSAHQVAQCPRELDDCPLVGGDVVEIAHLTKLTADRRFG